MTGAESRMTDHTDSPGLMGSWEVEVSVQRQTLSTSSGLGLDKCTQRSMC
jgi:hypothetical protein